MTPKTLGRLFHRQSLRLFVAAAVLLIFAGRFVMRPTLQAQGPNPVSMENQLPGDGDWDISGAGDPSIQGFATDISIDNTETVHFKIASAGAYRIDIYRLGYYGGQGARKVATVPGLPSRSQPACTSDNATGLYDCGNWSEAASWNANLATSGIYLAKLTRTDGSGGSDNGSSHIVFVVRDDARQADVLVQTSDTTWQAYNRYGTGSTYCGGPVSNAGSAYANSCASRSVKVSYNRPFDTRAHDPQSWLFNAEYPMLRWLEANGYNVKYWAGVDTDRRGADLTGARKPKAFLSVGHDEYWSGNQRTRIEAARNAGVHLSFFSGNEMFWKTRYEPSIDGFDTPYRTLVAYKETLAGAKLDPTSAWTGTWRDPRFSPPADGGRPENALTGTLWTVNSGAAALTVPASMARLRLWQHTRVADLTSGVAVMTPETVGYEWDEDIDNGSRPGGLIHLSSTTVVGVERLIDYGGTVQQNATATHNLTLYRHNSGALVFGAGTVQWSWGLDGDHDRGSTAAHVPDQAIQQATVNLLADMGAQPGTLQAGADPNRPLTATAASADIFAPTSTITSPSGGTVDSGARITINGTAADNGAGVVASVEVSVDGGASWHVASGTTTWSFEWSPSVVGAATIRTRAIDDSGNLESAGAGVNVSVVIGVCPCTSLWRPGTTPTIPSASDPSAVELGVKFKSDIGGFITGIRFYKGPSNSGTHVGNLWSISGGAPLATAVFANETQSGWQQVSFNVPVAITANTTYLASYHTNVGGYSADGAYFANAAVDSPPLHALTSASSGGNGVYQYGVSSFPSNSFNATNYWVDVVFAPTLADSTAPAISAIRAATIDSSRVTISWATDEEASSRLDYGTNPAILTDTNPPPGTLAITDNVFSTQHMVALTGLQPNTTYYYRLTAADRSGNTTRVAAPSFTVPGPTLRDTTATDFAAGTRTNTYVSQTADGEAILAPVTGSEFSGPSLPTGWIETPWGSEGYSVIVNGVLLVDGARVASCVTDSNGVCLPENTVTTPSAIYTPPHSLEFSANFSGDQFQHAGFAVTFGSASEPWAIFSTLSGGLLFARTNTGSAWIDTPLGTGLLGGFHRYRIDWKPAGVDYYVDGALVASHALAVSGPMRPVAASDYNPFGGNVFVDWMRMSSYAGAGAFESRIFDATTPVAWRSAQWLTRVPAGSSVAISVRTGNTPTPDGSWSGFAAIQPGPLSLYSRYIQYRADMTSSDPTQTPALEDIIISTGQAPVAVADSATVPENGAHTFAASGPGSLTINDTDADSTDTLRVVAVTSPAHGTAVVNPDGSVTYTPATNYSGPDAFVYVVSDGLLTASAPVTLDVRFGNIQPVANNDFYSVNEDTTLSVGAAAGILANDTDVEHDPLTAVLVSPPVFGNKVVGTLALSASGGFSYTPALNFAGDVTFTYKANDGVDNGNVATVTIRINQVNDAPITEADAFTAVLNQPLDVPAPGVLRNDHDVEVEDTVPLHPQLVSPPAHGRLTLRADGSFSYVPDADYLGLDSFTYAAVDHFDAVGNVNTVTLTVAIKAVSAVVTGGASVTTGGDVSAADPLQSTVTSPSAATVAIAQGVIAASQSPTGYTFLNQQVNITLIGVDGTEVSATFANPIKLTFMIDRSLMLPGENENTMQMFRNGVLIPNCLAQPPLTSIPAANLDPCITKREDGPALNNNVRITLITSHASRWNLGLSSQSVGDNPVAQDDGSGYAVDFQTPLIVAAPGVLGNDYGRNSLNAVLSPGSEVGGTVDLASSGGFTFKPTAGFCGTASFKYKAHDGSAASNEALATLLVDCRPHAGADSVTVLEDSGASTITVLSNDSDPDPNQTLRVIDVTPGTNGGVVAIVAGGMAVSYAPQPNFFGAESFTYTVGDGHNGSATATVDVTVKPVNDAPSFTKGADQTPLEDGGPQSVAAWATNLSAGPANENGQVLSFIVTNSNNALFSSQPVVDAGGTLTYTPAGNANGSAIVSLKLQDDGGVSDEGANTSAVQTFTIDVTPVNDAPSFTKGGNLSLNEDTGAQSFANWATAISAGPANEAGQALTFLVSSDNPALFTVPPAIASDGTLTFDPALNANGTATVTVQLKDNGGKANGGVDLSAVETFTIRVNFINDAPSFTRGADQTVLEDAGAISVPGWATALSAGPPDEAGQALNFLVGNSNNALFSAQPAISPNGTLTFGSAPDAFGSAIVTVELHDDGGRVNGGADTSVPQTFVITVTAVNDAPVASSGSLTLDEDTSATGALNATDVEHDPLVYSIVANGTKGTATITNTATGAFSYTPIANANGPDAFTFRAYDGAAYSNIGTISVTINPVNDPPVANADSVTVLEDSGPNAINVLANDNTGPDTGETLTIASVTQGVGGAVAITGGGTGLTYTPMADYSGLDSFTYTIGDGNGGTATATVSVSVTPINDAPSFVKGPNQAVWGNAGPQIVANWATGISKGPADESGQTLTFQVTGNTNGALFSAQPAVSPTGTLTYAPMANVSGTATITLVLKDDGGVALGGVDTSAAQTFTISVNKATTSTTVVSSNLNPAKGSLFGVSLTFTATVAAVAPGTGVAGGTVTFKDGSTQIGTGTLDAGGQATFTTKKLTVGTHQITAVYAGAGNYLASTSPAISQVISPSAALSVSFIIHALQDGTSKPKVREEPVAGGLVRVYLKKSVCADGLIVSGQPRVWGRIFDGLDGYNAPSFNGRTDSDPGCEPLKFGSYVAEGTTDDNGKVSIIVPPTVQHPDTDYVVIGRTVSYDYIRTTTPVDVLYSEKTLETVRAGSAKQVLLHQIRTFSGKQVPGRDIEEFGSYLAIVEPEYLDWTTDQEQYPFIFISDGDWGVTTSVQPPEGFVPDYPSLSTTVTDAIVTPVTTIDGFAAEYPILAPTDGGTTAVQFTLTDVGSDWTETGITHVITHKGGTRVRKSAVPMFNKQTPREPNRDDHGKGEPKKEHEHVLTPLPSHLITPMMSDLR